MPSNYTGNPGSTQAPGPAPELGEVPIGALPLDSDTPNVSSILQPFKECLDWIAFLSVWADGVAASIVAAIASALGTLSGVVATGVEVTTGDATISGGDMHTFNFPGTTYKVLVFAINIGADDTNIITLTGAAAFANTAIAGFYTKGGRTPNYVSLTGSVTLTGAATIQLTVDAGDGGNNGGLVYLAVFGY
jgi:hypothetical protein